MSDTLQGIGMTLTQMNTAEEDRLIQALLDAKGKRVEIIAFGILYVGTLKKVDIDNGTIIIANGDDQAMIEIERVESFSLAAL
jgi:hypothetical protein